MTGGSPLKSSPTATEEGDSNDPIQISNRVLILNSILFVELVVVMILLLSFSGAYNKDIAIANLLLGSGCTLIYYYRAETSSKWWYVSVGLSMVIAVVFGMLAGV